VPEVEAVLDGVTEGDPDSDAVDDGVGF